MANIDRAKEILNSREGKALLDMIAFAEGTAGVSQNGYDVMQNFYKLIDWTENTNIVHGGTDWSDTTGGTTAFGRYQFLVKTWKSTSDKMFGIDNAPVSKKNQDLFGAWKIYQKTSRSQSFSEGKFAGIKIPKPPALSSLNASNFYMVLDSLAPVWASLPFSQNGGKGFYSDQDGKFTVKKLYDLYTQALAKY